MTLQVPDGVRNPSSQMPTCNVPPAAAKAVFNALEGWLRDGAGEPFLRAEWDRPYCFLPRSLRDACYEAAKAAREAVP
jgi:hypothetical protein